MNNTTGQKFRQTDFYDEIIRFRKDYFRIKKYIKNNPLNWQFDNFNS